MSNRGERKKRVCKCGACRFEEAAPGNQWTWFFTQFLKIYGDNCRRVTCARGWKFCPLCGDEL